MAAAGGHWSKNGNFVDARSTSRQQARTANRQLRRSSSVQLQAQIRRRLTLR